MEPPLNDRAQKRARLSLIFGLIWLSHGPLGPLLQGSLSPASVALAKIIFVIEKTGLILWVGSGVACVSTAFPEPKNPRSWQGKTAVFLAVLVLLCFLLWAILQVI